MEFGSLGGGEDFERNSVEHNSVDFEELTKLNATQNHLTEFTNREAANSIQVALSRVTRWQCQMHRPS